MVEQKVSSSDYEQASKSIDLMALAAKTDKSGIISISQHSTKKPQVSERTPEKTNLEQVEQQEEERVPTPSAPSEKEPSSTSSR